MHDIDLTGHNDSMGDILQISNIPYCTARKKTTPVTTTHHCKLHLGKHQHLLPMQTVCHHRTHYIMIRQEGLISITNRQIERAVKTGTWAL